MTYNNYIQSTHFRGVSFVANATSLALLQWSADARFYISRRVTYELGRVSS
jgi:hypothetical protein